MDNKERYKDPDPNDAGGNEVVPMDDDGIQPNDAIEIKQEIGIKEEPWEQSHGLVEIPIANYSDIQIKLEDGDRANDCTGFVSLSPQSGVITVPKKEMARKGTTNSSSSKERGRNNANSAERKDVAAPKNVPLHRCGICAYVAKCKSQLDIHSRRKHTGEKPFGCKHCGKHFFTKSLLIAHLKIHVGEFPFHCTSCLEGFNTGSAKKTHEMNCTVRRYECHVCKASLGPYKSNLVIHLRTHSGETPFECRECSKQFKSKKELNRHTKVHTLTLFHCLRCHKKFTHQVEKNVHELECNCKLYACYICGKSSGSIKPNLIAHMRIHTGETPFECPNCSKPFAFKGSLTRHIKTHSRNDPFKCSICQQGFSNEPQRRAHQKNCKRRGYECHLCKKFQHSKRDLIIHFCMHSGEKPFKCEHCGKGFTAKRSVKLHKKSIICKKKPKKTLKQKSVK